MANGPKGISERIDVLSACINGFFAKLSGIFILIIGLIVTYDIFMRFVFGSPTVWVLELSIYLCISSVFLSAGYAHREKAHINVDIITLRVSIRDRTLIDLLTSILGILYVLILIWKGGQQALSSLLVGEVSTTILKVPVFIPRFLVPLGGILLLIEFVNQLLKLLPQMKILRKTREKGSHLPDGLFPAIFAVFLVVATALLLSEGNAHIGLGLLLFLLLFSGMPVGFAMGFLGALGFFLMFGGFQMLIQVPLVAYKVLDDFILVAVPLFMMTSSVLMIGGVGRDLFDVANKWVRHLPGGLGVAAILACAVFAAISGSSTATVATIGLIALPEMISAGYPRTFSFGVVAIGGVLGPLIPPSIYMIVIGSMTGESVGKLFMAGMLPGIMLAAIFGGYAILHSRRSDSFPRMDPLPWRERWIAARKGSWGLLTPVIILGGIYTGIFTPTEAAGIGLTYGLFISLFVYRYLSVDKLWKIMVDTAKLNSMILFIVAGALIFGQVITMMEIPQKACSFLAGLPVSPMTILLLVLVLIIILGALMDELSILLITYPILYQIFVKNFGFDPIWFALVFVFTLEVGLVAPPVGINLFVVQGIYPSAKFLEVVKGVLPFAFLMMAAILIVIYVKPLSVWLPGLVG